MWFSPTRPDDLEETGRTTTSRPARRPARRPTIAFVDAGRWESFHQLAGLLRHAGCRCVRITSEPSVLKRSLSRLLFQQVLYRRPDEVAAWLGSASASAMSDVLVTDEVIAAIDASGGAAGVGAGDLVQGRDKLRHAELFARHGIPQPAYLEAAHTSVESAVAELGLPLVVKRSLGYGGYGVRVAADADEVSDAVEALGGGGPLDGVFFQRFVEGPEYCYGCTALDGVPLQEVTYKRMTAVARQHGQSTSSVVVDDPVLVALGRSVVEALGASGFVNLGAIRSADGAYHVIDLNPRPWGGFASLLDLDLDFGEGYLHAIGASADRPEPGRLEPDQAYLSFPFWHEARLVGDGPTAANVAAYLADARTYRRSISTRYWLETMAFTALHVAFRRPEARTRQQAEGWAPALQAEPTSTATA